MTEVLHKLLREETQENKNGWFETRERLGQTAGDPSSSNRAWHSADGVAAKGDLVVAIGFQVRYALILTSLNSLAEKIQPDLLALLVEETIWLPAQGLVYWRVRFQTHGDGPRRH